MIKVGVLGVGHLGKIHLKCLMELGQRFEVVTFFDPSTVMAKEAMDITGLMPSHSVDHLLDQVDAVIIASNTATHFELANKCIRAFKHVFIEKPVCVDMQEAKALLRLAQEAGVIVQIGHVERFNPVFTTALPHIKTPKMIVCHRLSPVNDRGMDVSVVMDLMIHDIDLVLHLTKASPRKILAYGIPWRGKELDVAHVTMEMDNGTSVHLYASRIHSTSVRTMQLLMSDQMIELDFMNHQWRKLSALQPLPGADWIAVDKGNAIVEELAAFAHSIEKNKTPQVTLEDAIKSLEVALTIGSRCDQSLFSNRTENFETFLQ
jgi:predicted dehydrogenase